MQIMSTLFWDLHRWCLSSSSWAYKDWAFHCRIFIHLGLFIIFLRCWSIFIKRFNCWSSCGRRWFVNLRWWFLAHFVIFNFSRCYWSWSWYLTRILISDFWFYWRNQYTIYTFLQSFNLHDFNLNRLDSIQERSSRYPTKHRRSLRWLKDWNGAQRWLRLFPIFCFFSTLYQRRFRLSLRPTIHHHSFSWTIYKCLE